VPSSLEPVIVSFLAHFGACILQTNFSSSAVLSSLVRGFDVIRSFIFFGPGFFDCGSLLCSPSNGWSCHPPSSPPFFSCTRLSFRFWAPWGQRDSLPPNVVNQLTLHFLLSLADSPRFLATTGLPGFLANEFFLHGFLAHVTTELGIFFFRS